MKKTIYFKQNKPITVVMLASLLIFLSLIPSKGLHSSLILFSIGLFLFGYKNSYVVSQDFNNKKVFSIFGIPIFKSSLKLDFPEYISLFGSNYSKRNDWGPVAAIGTNSNADMIAIKLFNGNKNITLFKSEKYEVSKKLAVELSNLLQVELIDNVKRTLSE